MIGENEEEINVRKGKENGEGRRRERLQWEEENEEGNLHFDPSSFRLLFDKIIFNNATFIHIHTNIKYISTPNTHIH